MSQQLKILANSMDGRERDCLRFPGCLIYTIATNGRGPMQHELLQFNRHLN